MTRLILTSLLALFLPLLILAQPKPTAKEQKEVKRFINQLQIKRFLKQAEATTLMGQDHSALTLFPAIYAFYKAEADRPVSPDRAKKGNRLVPSLARLRILAELVTQSRLVPPFICDSMRSMIRQDKFRWYAEVNEIHEAFQFLAEYSQQTYDIENGVVAAYLDSLYSIGLVTESGRDEAKVEPPMLPEQIPDFLDQALLISPDQLPSDPAKAYQIALNKISELRPDLAISDFTFEMESPPSPNQGYSVAKIGFRCKGQQYLFYNNLAVKLGKKDYAGLGNQFYQIFNRILIENGSELRLVSVNVGQKFGDNILLLLLKQAQYEKLGRTLYVSEGEYFSLDWYKLFVPNKDRSFSILSTQEIEAYLVDFKRLGFYKGVHPDVLAWDRKGWRQSFVYSPWSLLYDVGFLLTAKSDFKPLSCDTLLSRINLICRNELQPKAYWIDFQDDTAQFTYTFGQDTAEVSTLSPCEEHTSHWVAAFNAFFQRQGYEGQLYLGIIPNDGSYLALHPDYSHSTYCLYLTPEQYAYVREKKLLLEK